MTHGAACWTTRVYEYVWWQVAVIYAAGVVVAVVVEITCDK